MNTLYIIQVDDGNIKIVSFCASKIFICIRADSQIYVLICICFLISVYYSAKKDDRLMIRFWWMYIYIGILVTSLEFVIY